MTTKNIRSFDSAVNFQLFDQFSAIETALNNFSAGMTTARERAKDYVPEKRKPLLQEVAKPLIDSVMKTLDSSVKNVDGRFKNVASNLQNIVTNSKEKRTDIQELTYFLKVDRLQQKISTLEPEARRKIFYDATTKGDDLTIDAFRDTTLQPLMPPMLLESELAAYDEAKINAVAGKENDLLSVLSDARSEIQRSAATVKQIIIDELAADGIRPQDFSTVGEMTAAEKSAYVDKHGLESFKRLVDGF